MRHVDRTFALLACVAVACVNGTTPDCTSVDSGCFPFQNDSGPPSDSGQSDASDASSEGSPEASDDAAVDSAVDSPVD
jgi:hypothetical protein